MIDFHSQLSIIPEVYDTATLQDNLEHSGGISLSWKSKTDDEIPLGSYLTYGGTRYVLMQPYAPSKESPVHYHYNPTFKHPQALFDFTPFWIKSKDAQGNDINLRTTSYTGFPYVIAQKLVNFMAEYANEMNDTFFAETIGLTKDANDQWQATWTFNIPQVVDGEGRVIDPHTIITVSFDGSSIKGAADSIATAMGCNVFFDWSSKTIRFVAGTTIQGESYNCFHVLGGTTNMGKNTASGSFAAITQRLTLDETQYPGSIIKRGAALTQGGIMLTKELIFDDIYPKMELYIKDTHERECYLTNEEGDFIVDHFDANDEPVYKTYSKWYISLSKDAAGTIPYKFDQSTLINDKPLSLLFQLDYKNPEHMSALVGRQFEMTYFPEPTKEWDKTDVERDYSQAWEVPAGWFRIALVAEGDVLLPTSSGNGLYPQKSDKVTLVNVALTDEKSTAQGELLAAAQEIIELMETPAGEYTETVILGKEVNGRTINSVVIGQETPFEAGVPAEQRKHGPVVTQINHNLDTDVADVTVGSWTRKTRSGGTSDKLETVTVSANSSTNGGDNYSNGSIGEGGGYGGNSNETLNQTTLKPDSLFVASLSNTIDAVSCDADGKVRIASDIYTKIDGHYGTKDVTAACTVAVPALPLYDDTDPNNVLYIDLYVTDKSSDTVEITQTNYAYDLSETRRWIKVHIPAGYDMKKVSDSFLQSFLVEHPAYKERQLDFVVNAMRQGINGIGGAFKSRVFARTNVDISSVTPTGGTYNNPYPGGTNPCTQTYTINGQQVSVTWSDGIPNDSDAKLWSTVRTFYDNTSNPGSWSNPAPETDTATLDIEFSPSATKPNPPIGNTPIPKTDTTYKSGDSTHGSRANGSGQSADWYDADKDKTNTHADWTAMIWRAERKVTNGVYSGGWVISRIYGEKGNNGGNTATVMLYKRTSNPDTDLVLMPTQTLWYKFSDRKLYYKNGNNYVLEDGTHLNGWSQTIPNDSTDSIYVTSAIAYSATDYDDIVVNQSTCEWVTPALYTENGAHGINSAPVFLYKRSGDNITSHGITTDFWYRFEDGNLYTKSGSNYTIVQDNASVLNGWHLYIPATDGNHYPCYVIQAAALSAEDYDVIEVTGGKNDWSTVRKMVEDGAPGGNTATVMLYKRSSSAVSTIGINIPLYYKFEKDSNNNQVFTDEACTTPFTNQTTGGNEWSPTIPSGTDDIYVVAAVAFSNTEKDIIRNSEWVGPVLYTENGAQGEHGINSAVVTLYRRATSSTALTNSDRPTGTFNYTFATGVLAANAGADFEDWSQNIPASNGYPCYVIQAMAISQEAVDNDVHEWNDVSKLVEDGKNGNSVTYDAQGSSIGYAYSSMGSPETGRAYPSDIRSWSSTIPAVQKGKYLWREDITAYKNSDGSSAGSTTTYGVEYQPNDGESVEIDTNRTFIKYCKQTSSQYTGEHPDDNLFSTTYPSDLANGDYLWILNQLAYVGVTNPLKSYSVSMLGTDGNNGDPGADGYTTHFAYATIQSGQTLPADGKVTRQNYQTYFGNSFSTTNYNGATVIGTYRDQNSSDSPNAWVYTWTQWKGDKGDNGRGITNTNIYYKAASSTPAKPSGNPTGTGWSDDGNSLITDTNADKHLYESTCTTYSDGTYSWTTPVDDGLISDMAATSEEFALSDSSTTAPTSGWSTSVTPTAGKWIWSRTVLTFRTGNNKYINTQCVGYTGTNGHNGLNGYNTATLYLYSRTKTTKDWSNTLTYTFSTKSLDSVPTGWTLNQIPSGTGTVYVTAATAFNREDTDTIDVGEWSTPVPLAEDGKDGKDGKDGADGKDGNNGLNSAPVFIYKRAASKPSDTAGSRDVPDNNSVYTFATGVLAPPQGGSLNNWSTDIPSTDSNHHPCWVRHATAANITATDEIGSGEWSGATKLVEDGANGTSVIAQYAPNNNPTEQQIHNTFQSGDKYMRTSSDGGVNWSGWQKIVGEDGKDGKDGDYTVFSFNISDLLTGVNGSTAYPDHLGYATWQDAPPATTSTMKYLWCEEVRHTFVNGVDTPGTASYFRITGEEGQDGTSPYVADLDNEMDSVACTLQGKPSSAQSVSSNVSLYYGSGKINFKVISIKKNNGHNGSYGTEVTVKVGDTIISSASSFDSLTASDSAKIEVSYTINATINGKDVYTIVLQKDNDESIQRTLTLTINGVRPGQNGADGTNIRYADSHVPVPAGTTVPDGFIQLIPYGSIGDDAYEVYDEENDEWESYAVSLGETFICADTEHIYSAKNNGWVDMGRFTGSSPTIYNLKPSQSQINVGRTDIGGYSPSTVSLTCKYTQRTGDSPIQEKSITGQIDSTYNVYFRKRQRSNNQWQDYYYLYTSYLNKPDTTYSLTGFNVATFDAVEFIMCTAPSSVQKFPEANINQYTVIDRETVPIVSNGMKGRAGDDGCYYLDEFGRASSRELDNSGYPSGLDDELGWQLTAPEADNTYPYIWKRSRLWDPNEEDWAEDSEWSYVCETGKQGPEGDDAPFEVRDYALGNSYTTHPTGVTWQATAPDRTVGTFVWMRIRSFNGGDDPATATPQNTSYVCLTGDPGQNGGTGHAGRWYDYDGVWGVDTLSVTNTANVGYYVLYYYNGTSKHFYMNTMDDGVANTTPPADSSGVANSGWEQIQDDREYYIVKAIFGDYAQFGSFIINGDWMISTNGTIDGVAYNNGALYNGSSAYTYFDEDNPNTNTGSNFIPNFAIDGLTGETYQNLAHVRGEIEAESGHIGGFVIGSTQLKSLDNNIVLDSNNKKISVGIIDIESGEGSEGDFPYNWSGIATKSGYGDTVALGAREFPNNGNALYGGHLRLNSSNGGVFDILTGGNTQQALLRMSGKGLNNIRIIADGGKNSDYNDSGLAFIQVVTTDRGADNKSTTIKPTNINTPEVKTNSITTKEVKTTSESIPVALPHNVVLCNSTSYTLPPNPTKGEFIFFKSKVSVTINTASETAKIYESQGSNLYPSISIGGEAAIFVFDGTNWILFLSH